MRTIDDGRRGNPVRGPGPSLMQGWYKLGGAGAAACAQAAVGYLHPAVGVVLAVTDFIVPLAVGLVLVIAILRGSQETCERVFRLL